MGTSQASGFNIKRTKTVYVDKDIKYMAMSALEKKEFYLKDIVFETTSCYMSNHF